ncbi:MAG: serine/threonine-protein kinase, partial [Chloroflexi bacterium]|nr:serine/threonine-protein kinase [Chloroflexota bacterium]
MADISGRSLGRYHILEQLGEGGMATVYKAYDTRLERDVAVKVIRMERLTIETMPRALKRFEREAKSLGKLTHPNIVPVSDYGEFDGKPYLVMPYLPGGTLKQKMGKPMPWQEAVQLLLPIAEALDYAHSQNMIHRDVKPANILLTQRGQPMLTDFGIAKVLDLEETLDLTGTSAAVGTPEYMAPEQATAKFVDHRVDIYSLGVVFYEMVTGRKPFIADTPLAVLIKHATEALPRPTKFAPNLPDDVEKILLKVLAKQPENRYQDMDELVCAFQGALAGKVFVEKADRDRKEYEAAERAERERKELREKQAREASEKARRETEKKEDKPVVAKPKAGGQFAYWFGGLIVLAFGIAFLSSLKNSSSSPQTTPENTQTQVIATSTQDNVQPSPTAMPKSTSTP